MKEGARGTFPASVRQGPCNYPAPRAGGLSRPPPRFPAPGCPAVSPQPSRGFVQKRHFRPCPPTASLGDLTPGARSLPHPCRTPAGRPVQGSPHGPLSLSSASPGSLHRHFRLLLSPGLALATVPLGRTFRSSLQTGGNVTCIFPAAAAGPKN